MELQTGHLVDYRCPRTLCWLAVSICYVKLYTHSSRSLITSFWTTYVVQTTDIILRNIAAFELRHAQRITVWNWRCHIITVIRVHHILNITGTSLTVTFEFNKQKYLTLMICQRMLGYKTCLDTKPVLYQDRLSILYRSYKTGFGPKRVDTKPV